MARERFHLRVSRTTRFRIFEVSETSSADAPLFWIELFDHDAQSSVDSRACRDIKEAAAAFEDFISR